MVAVLLESLINLSIVNFPVIISLFLLSIHGKQSKAVLLLTAQPQIIVTFNIDSSKIKQFI